ncbi:hypothetical protein MYSTI_06082 [Myxococcus stipitatus DSM 14675]|uniref:Lipoprotein n=1 Tax=Myxococcus stipitatus (strain DSM 14675 / JCM 12634 / Mx s8) TaxID=1278073 RepID=L7UHI4_MYXSD|nr:hypothetical protein [Myxococcus stipitatus]AGC47355.1 hypothetical protein MYSTI_06082 [Myxococcus stipitatus DSM 14675]
MLPILALFLLASTPAIPPPRPAPPAPVTPPPRVEPAPQPVPNCLSSQGQTACGFNCQSARGGIACAQTPYGTCAVHAGQVHCWDPPRVAIQHPSKSSASPECKEVRGKVACGFNCRVNNGEVACNTTPYGVCKTHFGRLVCWDPPASVIHEYASDTPTPGCLNASESIACGYGCKAIRGEVHCASTPRGVCAINSRSNQFTCFDPPSLLHCDHSEPPPPPRG